MTSTKPILKSQKSGSAISSKKEIPPAGGGNNRGNSGGGNGGSQDPPSPWLDHPSHPDGKPNPNSSASFVEYLRWMRSLKSEEGNKKNKTENNGTRIQLLSQFEETADYATWLNRLTSRTQNLVKNRGICFEVTAKWRIRIGGIRGVESMLLPAFDALGMPYIPSSTLKGVARSMARQDILNGKYSEDQINEIFGDIKSKSITGKIIFLDAYPQPSKDLRGGVTPDMANQIWIWNKDGLPEYKSNPNDFLSLLKSTFVIGIVPASTTESRELIRHIQDTLGEPDSTLLDQVQRWLIDGLAQGIGSRVNSGYGGLENPELKAKKSKLILKIPFKLNGQMIHGRQTFNKWKLNGKSDNWSPPGISEAENRPIAFRCILRYWFRTLALGIEGLLVSKLEKEIFGGIDPSPACNGLVRVEIENVMDTNQVQEGILILRLSTEALLLTSEKQDFLMRVLQNLTWLSLHLGGVGQGARRLFYKRSSSPKIRGSSISSDWSKAKWDVPKSLDHQKQLFQNRLKGFFNSLAQLQSISTDLSCLANLSGHRRFNGKQNWHEALDSNARILLVQGESGESKPYALDLLHEYFHQLEQKDKNLAKQLCGDQGTPSPIWVSKLDVNTQVVTIFGANQEPRKQYLEVLCKDAKSYVQIFPIA